MLAARPIQGKARREKERYALRRHGAEASARRGEETSMAGEDAKPPGETPGNGGFLERFFGLAERGTTARREVLAGLTTFRGTGCRA
jgi:hypothetical protein